jgi:hypothetical protein
MLGAMMNINEFGKVEPRQGTEPHVRVGFTVDKRLLKIAQQLQCWVRDAANHQSPLRTKEMFCRPWRDFMNGVRLPQALKCWAIFKKLSPSTHFRSPTRVAPSQSSQTTFYWLDRAKRIWWTESRCEFCLPAQQARGVWQVFWFTNDSAASTPRRAAEWSERNRYLPMDRSSQGWSRSVKASQAQSRLVKVGQGWSRLVKVGQGWSRLVKVGQGWSRLVKVGQGQSSLVKVRRFSHELSDLFLKTYKMTKSLPGQFFIFVPPNLRVSVCCPIVGQNWLRLSKLALALRSFFPIMCAGLHVTFALFCV